ncbi:unnamed protein product [Effrenium voratum]|uniref:Uncharacterized protein n=2 Tax=Effrenium voratum TaxID=2562239 RepID=A0AA36JJA4_9DINO|nr:unnamed protein product [Effrenium voratum]
MEGYASFQKSPVRNRTTVNRLVPRALQRTTTDDTQTAINRVVHEALARAEAADTAGAAAGASASPELAEDVKGRVELVLQAKQDELSGTITHAQRLELIQLIARLSVSDALEERRQMQHSNQRRAEETVRGSILPCWIWSRIFCLQVLPVSEVLQLGASCRLLRQNHSMGLRAFKLPCLLDGEDPAPDAPLVPRPVPATTMKLLVHKFRYAQSLEGRRGARLFDSDLELLPFAQLRRLDLGFCTRLAEGKLLACLKACVCLAELSLRGCLQLTSPSFPDTVAELRSLSALDVRGCENVNSDGLLQKCLDLRLTSLRLAHACPLEIRDAYEETQPQLPNRLITPETFQSLCSLPLASVELDLLLLSSMRDAEVQKLATIPQLQALLLWNVERLNRVTFQSIVERFAAEIDTVAYHHCYDEYDAYFHVVPSAWGLEMPGQLQGFCARAFFPPGAAGAGGKTLLLATSFKMNPQEAFEAMMTRALEVCQPRRLIFDAGVCRAEIGEALMRFGAFAEEVELYNGGFRESVSGFLSPMLQSCPRLRSLRWKHEGCLWNMQELELLVKTLAENCPDLERFEIVEPHRSPINTLASNLVYYYDGDPGRNHNAVNLATLQELLARCPRLEHLELPAPKLPRLSYWQLRAASAAPPRTLVFNGRNTSFQEELEALAGLAEDRQYDISLLNFGALTLPTIAFVTRFRHLRSLRLGQVDGSYVGLVVHLPERCPDLQRLCLQDLPLPAAQTEALLDALGGLPLLEALDLRVVPEEPKTAFHRMLPALVRRLRRLRELQLPTLAPCALWPLLAPLRRLATLEVTLDSALPLPELLLKVVARCPDLQVLMLDKLENEPQVDEVRIREVLRQAPGLQELAWVPAAVCSGLMYSNGFSVEWSVRRPNRVTG